MTLICVLSTTSYMPDLKGVLVILWRRGRERPFLNWGGGWETDGDINVMSDTGTRKPSQVRPSLSEAMTCKLESVGQSWGVGRDKQMDKRVTNSSGLLGPEGLPGT